MNGASRRVRLDHRDLLRQPVRRTRGDPGRRVRVVRLHVQARQPLVELRGGRHLARHEAELFVEPDRQRLGRQAERHAVGRVGEDDRREREQQLPVLGRGLPPEDLHHLGELRALLLRVGRDHGWLHAGRLGARRRSASSEGMVHERVADQGADER